jgi:hypothetical protein
MSSENQANSARVTPYPLAIIICDGIWRDPYTGKCTLLGTFSALGGKRFPLVHPILSVYISITDGRGKIPLRLELVDVDEQREPIFSMEEEVEFADPRMICEVNFQAAGIQFPESGEYRLKLFANNEFLIERRIVVYGPPEGASK